MCLPFLHCCSLVNMCVFVCLPGLGVEGATDQAGRGLSGLVIFSHLHRAAERVFNRGEGLLRELYIYDIVFCTEVCPSLFVLNWMAVVLV